MPDHVTGIFITHRRCHWHRKCRYIIVGDRVWIWSPERQIDQSEWTTASSTCRSHHSPSRRKARQEQTMVLSLRQEQTHKGELFSPCGLPGLVGRKAESSISGEVRRHRDNRAAKPGYKSQPRWGNRRWESTAQPSESRSEHREWRRRRNRRRPCREFCGESRQIGIAVERRRRL